MDAANFLLPLLFFLTALSYAMVGFGGGSTYLALLVLFGLPYTTLPKIALLCNLIVVSGGCYHFARAGHLPWRRVLPWILLSIPMAYVGGRIPISQERFLLLLGLSLAVAGLRLFFIGQEQTPSARAPAAEWAIGIPAGAGLGLLSGLVGLGGGIFLAPIFYFLRWGSARHIAAAASLFIWVNSLAGLCGQVAKSGLSVDGHWLLPLGVCVFLGGQVGSRLGSRRLPALGLQRITAVFVLWVAGRILWTLAS